MKRFVFKKIAQLTRDRWSHLCVGGYTEVGCLQRNPGSISMSLIHKSNWMYSIERPSRVTVR